MLYFIQTFIIIELNMLIAKLFSSFLAYQDPDGGLSEEGGCWNDKASLSWLNPSLFKCAMCVTNLESSNTFKHTRWS